MFLVIKFIFGEFIIFVNFVLVLFEFWYCCVFGWSVKLKKIIVYKFR